MGEVIHYPWDENQRKWTDWKEALLGKATHNPPDWLTCSSCGFTVHRDRPCPCETPDKKVWCEGKLHGPYSGVIGSFVDSFCDDCTADEERRAKAVEMKERAELARLKAKYET